MEPALEGPVRAEWTTAQVSEWFGRIGLPQYRKKVEWQGVDGKILLDIVDNSSGLVDLGIRNVVHQTKVRRWVRATKGYA